MYFHANSKCKIRPRYYGALAARLWNDLLVVAAVHVFLRARQRARSRKKVRGFPVCLPIFPCPFLFLDANQIVLFFFSNRTLVRLLHKHPSVSRPLNWQQLCRCWVKSCNEMRSRYCFFLPCTNPPIPSSYQQVAFIPCYNLPFTDGNVVHKHTGLEFWRF